MDRLLNAQKQLAARQAALGGQPRFGTVTSYNPNDGTAKVLIQPEGTQTGWLPVLSQSVGAGWGIHVPLKTGEQVLVMPHEGDANNGVIVGRAFSDQMQPPASAGADIVMKSSTGSIVTLSTNGDVSVVAKGKATLQDGSGSNIQMTNDGNVAINCSATLTFNVNQVAVNATTAIALTAPNTNVSNELNVGTGPIKQNGTVVVVP